MSKETEFLFSKPLTLRHTTLKNRFIMGSMHTGLEEEKNGFERLAAFYEERAKGGVALIVTGGIAPNRVGRLAPFSAKLTTEKEARAHQLVTERVHQHGAKIALQILHAGRYAYHPFAVAPSRIQAPITPYKPWALTKRGIRKTIRAFVNCALLAKKAGYDGVEIMGSEGYLLNQFLVTHTNQRTDQWGGEFSNRMRFPLAIISEIRKACGDDFILIYRLSMLDLIQHGSNWDEVLTLAKAVQDAGIDIINTGIGWHEARIPTIASMVPNAIFSDVTKKLRAQVHVPMITSNRINSPQIAEQLLQDGYADLISMARPFLADENFVNKAIQHQSEKINTCIACNQACLDQIFAQQVASCLVNPRAAHETLMPITTTMNPKIIAVIGAGPAGLACATTLAQRGHRVTLFEKDGQIGGQFNLAKQIPGKNEFEQTLRYYRNLLQQLQVTVKLNCDVTLEQLRANFFEEVVVATGVTPRRLHIEGIERANVLSYLDVLKHHKTVGKRVAIIGAGGIGFDVAEYLSAIDHLDHDAKKQFCREWGIDLSVQRRGGVTEKVNFFATREIFLLQRKTSKVGQGLGKTTGWIHRTELKNKGVQMLSGVEYLRIDDLGLHIRVDDEEKCLVVDTVVICAGQESEQSLYTALCAERENVHKIGGAAIANELDAKRAISEGTQLAMAL